MEHGEGTRRGVERSVNTLVTRAVGGRRDSVRPGESFGQVENFSPGRYKRWHTVRTQYEDGKRTWGRYEAVMDIVLYSDGLRTCACRLDNIFRSGNIYVGAAIHIPEPQYIFQSRNTYISEQQFQSSITYFRGGGMHTVITRLEHDENDKLELYEDGEFGTRTGRTRYRPGIDRHGPGYK